MAEAAEATVEWGEDERPRWYDRFLGSVNKTGPRRLSVPALGCGIVAAAMMLAAELLPWAVATTGLNDSGPIGGPGHEFFLSEAGGFMLAGYYPGWLVLLALIGLALVVAPATRRLLVAAGLGWAAGLLVITIGLVRQATSGGVFAGQSNIHANLGPGTFFGIAGVVVAAAALALTGWRPGGGVGRPRGAREPDVDPGPPDLTVTPLK
jgi:hypothetical protein